MDSSCLPSLKQRAGDEEGGFHDEHKGKRTHNSTGARARIVPIDREASKVKEPSMTGEHMAIDWVGRLCEDADNGDNNRIVTG